MSNVKKDDRVILNKCIYHLVQAVWQYCRKAVVILKSSGFIRCIVDLCLYVKRSNKGLVYIALYIDHNLMLVEIAAIDNAIETLKNKKLVLKIVEGLQDYLSCKIKFSNDKKNAWLGQPNLIKNPEIKFSRLAWDVWSS